jgi:RNA polymerase sigma factor (sigma-70 family)
VEASAIPAPVGLARTRITIGASLLRIRTDEQLVTLFREGNDEAFRVIHDRYRARMFAYARQMLGASGQDPEDAVQEIFMRAYHGLRASRRELALRAWLYRIAHNRCVDDLRRPQLVMIGGGDTAPTVLQDPVTKVEQRDALRRLISDVQRLPDQQRSALLMRELSGMSYSDVADALGVSVPAVKSLLVRARVGLAQASTARNTACSEIRADLLLAHDRGVRTSGLARRHLRECQNCREFRTQVRGHSRQLAALAPTLGPIGLIAKLLGLGGGGGGVAAGSSAMAGGGAAATGGSVVAASTSVAAGGASAGLLAGGAGHVVTLLAAAVVTAGGAVEIQHTLGTAGSHHGHPSALVAHGGHGSAAHADAAAMTGTAGAAAIASGGTPGIPSAGSAAHSGVGSMPDMRTTSSVVAGRDRTPITEVLDPDMYSPPPVAPPITLDPNASGATPGTSTGTTGSLTGADGTSGATGAGGTTDPGTASGTGTAPATSPPGSSGDGSSAGATGSESSAYGTSGSTATGASGSGSGTASGSSSGTVGQSTSAAASRTVVTFIQRRRTSHRHRMLDTLGTR